MVAVTLASKDGSPIAWTTWLAENIVASKGTIIIDDRIAWLTAPLSADQICTESQTGGPDADQIMQSSHPPGTRGQWEDPSPLVLHANEVAMVGIAPFSGLQDAEPGPL